MVERESRVMTAILVSRWVRRGAGEIFLRGAEGLPIWGRLTREGGGGTDTRGIPRKSLDAMRE